MADPLSIAASVVGIAVPALHATRLLLTDLQELKNAPSTMQQLQEDLRIIDAAITSLQAVDDTEWTVLGEEVAENSKTTIGTCQTACTSFRADIQRWTRHSTGGKLSWQDRASVGFFNQGRIKSLTEQLQSCKLTINSVAGVAVLYASIRNGHVAEEIRNVISSRQSEIADAIRTTEARLQAVEDGMTKLDLGPSEQDQQRRGEEEEKAFAVSLTLLRELLLKLQTETVAKAAAQSQGSVGTVTFGKQNSGFQAGTINGGVSGISFGKQSS
ncbi:ribonuclease F1 [Apiospora arundinis]|uniref:Azaphilone pigments biosynthesis cluster protein L N-terminal domain-containing protein n=1 Tax=Apiospora arundinis TaxID=335852 RepID=A0ABR2J3V0_9PEZI